MHNFNLSFIKNDWEDDSSDYDDEKAFSFIESSIMTLQNSDNSMDNWHGFEAPEGKECICMATISDVRYFA